MHKSGDLRSVLDNGPVVREVFFDSGAVEYMKFGAIFNDTAWNPGSKGCRTRSNGV